MPKKLIPGKFVSFKGLWVRGPLDMVPVDHFSDCLNTIYADAGVEMRDGMSSFWETNPIRIALYKPKPPFTGTNVPRIIALYANGNLHDLLLSQTAGHLPDIHSLIYVNPLMKDFGFVNFFGRCYISPSDGLIGLSGSIVYVYDGTGAAGFRPVAGGPPTDVMTAELNVGSSGKCALGDHLFSYALETASGFITRPCDPFVDVFVAGGGTIDMVIPVGPAGTAARWIIATKAILTRSDLTVPFDVGTAPFYPQYFLARIGDNTTTDYTADFYDESLVDSSDYLLTRLTNIPAGVGLLDYKGRMVSYGEYSDPSIVRVSEIGEPESFSETSGFFITDPSDSTGVRCATEFRGNLYVFKQQRGYVTQDNQDEASTWQVINFEKSIGTEQYGIAAVLDAKGSSSDGFILANRSGLVYFNGVFAEPEISYKIKDLWLRINQNYFHKIQVANDPIHKRLYCLVPLDNATEVSHIIYADYRDGLDPYKIKWSLWQFTNSPRSILIYTDFTNNIPSVITRIADTVRINTLNVNTPGNDSGVAVESYFQFAPVRYFEGVSHYNGVRIRATGSGTLTFRAYGEDKNKYVDLESLTLDPSPGREYYKLMNLVSEQCLLKVSCSGLNESYKLNSLQINGLPLWSSRP